MDGNGYESETDILAAVIHAIAFLVAIGYAQNYYFHLRMYLLLRSKGGALFTDRLHF